DGQSDAPFGRQRDELVDREVPPFQDPQHLPAHRAGRTDHRDLHEAPSPKRSCTARSARSASSLRITQEIRIGDVEIISMLIPSPASTSNMSAATPGCVFMPAPTSESLAIPSSMLNPTAPMSRASASSTASSRGKSASGAVNDMSV